MVQDPRGLPAGSQAPHEGNVKEGRERARVLLRQERSFVWNATNMTRQIREQCLSLFADYKARLRSVYVEVAEATLFLQNSDRASVVPRKVMDRLVSRWEVPDLTEAHDVQWVART